jgi:MFS family permease
MSTVKHTRSETRPGYEWIALSVTTVGALLASIQGSALLIALPNILVDLRAGFLTIMWVLLGYLLITTALVPVIGRLADIWGRKNLYNLGFAVFTLGSLLAGFANPAFHGWDLVFDRVIQGIGGALLFTNSTAIVSDAFKKGRIGLGLGVNQIAGAAGFVLGPVIGGLLTAISWRWIFWFNVPLGIFGTLWGMARLRDPVQMPSGQHLDLWGSLTSTLGLAGILLGLSFLSFPLVSASIAHLLLVAGLLVLALFLWIETRVPEPILNLDLFRNRLFSFAVTANFLNGLARGGVLFVLIFFLQGPYGKDPLTAGLMLIPFGLAFMAFGPISGTLSDHYGSRLLASLGLAISAAALLALAFVTATTPYWLLAVLMAFLGMGSGLFASPNTNAIMSTVGPERRGVAAGTRTLLANSGQMLSIAIIFPLVLANVPQAVLFKVFLYGGGMGSTAAGRAALQSFTHGLHEAFLFCAGVNLIAAIISALRPSHEKK